MVNLNSAVSEGKYAYFKTTLTSLIGQTRERSLILPFYPVQLIPSFIVLALASIIVIEIIICFGS